MALPDELDGGFEDPVVEAFPVCPLGFAIFPLSLFFFGLIAGESSRSPRTHSPISHETDLFSRHFRLPDNFGLALPWKESGLDNILHDKKDAAASHGYLRVSARTPPSQKDRIGRILIHGNAIKVIKRLGRRPLRGQGVLKKTPSFLFVSRIQKLPVLRNDQNPRFTFRRCQQMVTQVLANFPPVREDLHRPRGTRWVWHVSQEEAIGHVCGHHVSPSTIWEPGGEEPFPMFGVNLAFRYFLRTLHPMIPKVACDDQFPAEQFRQHFAKCQTRNAIRRSV